jgi:hypothetical protein
MFCVRNASEAHVIKYSAIPRMEFRATWEEANQVYSCSENNTRHVLLI